MKEQKEKLLKRKNSTISEVTFADDNTSPVFGKTPVELDAHTANLAEAWDEEMAKGALKTN